MAGGLSVLVTGGSGFLGQHVIKHLQIYAEDVTEIRVLDIVPYQQKLDFDRKFEIRSYEGSITDLDLVCLACHKVDAVIHVASLIDSRFLPNIKALKEINVKGTETVIQACIKENVRYLIYCGSISAVQGYKEVFGGNETSVTIPCPQLMIRDYGSTKYQAQKAVLNANGQTTANGSTLQTVALLPLTMYGELDNNLITRAFDTAAQNKGVFQRVGSGKALAQFAYVGNIAFSFVCALKTFLSGEDIGGQMFFVSDDTPPKPTFEFIQPYLKLHNYSLSSLSVPYLLVYFVLSFIQLLLYIISPLKRVSMSVSLSSIIFLNRTFYVTYDKARTLMSYFPIYTPEESLALSAQYYSKHKSKK